MRLTVPFHTHPTLTLRDNNFFPFLIASSFTPALNCSSCLQVHFEVIILTRARFNMTPFWYRLRCYRPQKNHFAVTWILVVQNHWYRRNTDAVCGIKWQCNLERWNRSLRAEFRNHFIFLTSLICIVSSRNISLTTTEPDRRSRSMLYQIRIRILITPNHIMAQSSAYQFSVGFITTIDRLPENSPIVHFCRNDSYHRSSIINPIDCTFCGTRP
jgi:hypothetical protein